MENTSDSGSMITAREESSFLLRDEPHFDLARQYLDALLVRERNHAFDLIHQALDRDVTIEQIYLHVFQTTQYEVGRLWQHGLISVGQEHYCTNATQTIMAMLYPRLFQTKRGPRRMVAACVQGELHELGLRMVADFFTLRGWDADYLGASTPVESVVSMIEQTKPDLLAIGVTMHTHLAQTQKTIDAVRKSESAGRTPILVGGYTFLVTGELWKRLGADGSARDARQAVETAERLLQRGNKS